MGGAGQVFLKEQACPGKAERGIPAVLEQGGIAGNSMMKAGTARCFREALRKRQSSLRGVNTGQEGRAKLQTA